MQDPHSTSTHLISPVVEQSTIELEPISILGAVYRLKPSNSTLIRDIPTGQSLNATDLKPSLFLTPPPHIEVQGEIEAPSYEDNTLLATFTNDIKFVVMAKGTFDFENLLTFNIAELENISLSSFLSAFAQRTGVKMQRFNGLIFTILLGDN
ncbi:hypothetical protein DID88_002903 [Monilinia fructigena]|uniref:Uncharacterized protein n=1 Tax=Monilinia fructigena TaxID=38457 RepID=A0A395INH9_9HELO|nr:hypothetical protein DID88_002903 [Monilinia fructigena]